MHIIKSNKTRNNKQWTEARFNSFIKSALRSASQRWPPRYSVLNSAFVESKINIKTGRMAKHYKCNSCKEDFPLKEVEVNHIEPVVPTTGFTSWGDTIERLFCEESGLEVLCKPCHRIVSDNERRERIAEKD